MNKRGQFFILAAVMLSIFLFSTAFIVNKVSIIGKTSPFYYYYAEDINRELNAFLDYKVYSGDSTPLDDFVSVLREDFREGKFDSNFLLIYGNKSKVVISNLGKESIGIGEENFISGSSEEISSRIRLGRISVDAGQSLEGEEIVLLNQESINLSFNEHVYKLNLFDINRIIFIVQNDFEDETYVEIR